MTTEARARRRGMADGTFSHPYGELIDTWDEYYLATGKLPDECAEYDEMFGTPRFRDGKTLVVKVQWAYFARKFGGDDVLTAAHLNMARTAARFAMESLNIDITRKNKEQTPPFTQEELERVFSTKGVTNKQAAAVFGCKPSMVAKWRVSWDIYVYGKVNYRIMKILILEMKHKEIPNAEIRKYLCKYFGISYPSLQRHLNQLKNEVPSLSLHSN